MNRRGTGYDLQKVSPLPFPFFTPLRLDDRGSQALAGAAASAQELHDGNLTRVVGLGLTGV